MFFWGIVVVMMMMMRMGRWQAQENAICLQAEKTEMFRISIANEDNEGDDGDDCKVDVDDDDANDNNDDDFNMGCQMKVELFSVLRRRWPRR